MNSLSFSNTKPDCILCLNGHQPDFSLFTRFSQTPIIAADGAANDLLQNGILPEFIVGDLDSFLPSLLPTNHGITIVSIPDQHSNDFEKALNFAINQGFSSVLITGFHGGDLEHSLNNISVLWKLYPLFSIMILVDSSLRLAIPVSDSFIYHSEIIGEIVSLLPAPHARITTQGLQWELQNEVLELSVREGARNVIVSHNPSIAIHEGKLLFFFDSRFPLIPFINK